MKKNGIKQFHDFEKRNNQLCSNSYETAEIKKMIKRAVGQKRNLKRPHERINLKKKKPKLLAYIHFFLLLKCADISINSAEQQTKPSRWRCTSYLYDS